MSAERKGPYAKLLREPFDDERIDSLTRAVLDQHETETDMRKGRTRLTFSPWHVGLVGAGALLLLASTALLLTLDDTQSPHNPGPLRLETLEPLASLSNHDEEHTSILRLEDHSFIEVEPGTTLRTRQNSGHRLELELTRGRATFNVEPGGPRRWQIDAGLATIEVIGTIFTVERGEATLTVNVERGRVAVESALIDRGRRLLEGGDQITISESSDPGASTARGQGERPANAPDAGHESNARREADVESMSTQTGPRRAQPPHAGESWCETATITAPGTPWGSAGSDASPVKFGRWPSCSSWQTWLDAPDTQKKR